MNATAYAALVTNEVRLLSREPAPVIWAVVLPLAAAVITPLVPAVAAPRTFLDGMSFAQVYQPVLVLFTASVLALQVLPTLVTQYREAGVLRRLRTTPVAAWHLLLAIVTLVLGLTVTMTALMVGGAAVAGLPLPTNLPAFALVVLLAALAFLAIGALICALASSSRSAGGIGGFVASVMWFAAGMWVPRAIFPPILVLVSDITPGGAAAGAMLRTMSGVWPSASQIIVLVLWAAVGFVIAARTFRFERS